MTWNSRKKCCHFSFDHQPGAHRLLRVCDQSANQTAAFVLVDFY